MGYAEKRGDYWRGRFKIAPGRYGTVSDSTGATIRFKTKRQAETAANDAEAKVRGGVWRDPTSGRIKFEAYVNRWYEAQDLAASTIQYYRHAIEGHLLPAFEDDDLVDITASKIGAWERRELAVPYAPSSVKGWRAVLHLILADAVQDGILPSNPASRRRGRGKRVGRASHRGPEKTITDALGILLIAERVALLSGRNAEFVAAVTKGYTGMRWGEIVGLETQYIRSKSIRVEWQLYELDTGEFHRCPPKDESRRTIDTPDFLAELLRNHVVQSQPKACDCHGFTYAFRGYSAANGAPRRSGPKMSDVARRAGVSVGTVSAVLNRPDVVAEATRVRVELAIAELGYVRGESSGTEAAHLRRNGFATWLFQPAVTGFYPKKAPYDTRPVPILGEPWPGIPVRGRGADARADACWAPIAPGLTPHGLRHTHKTMMEELRTLPKLMDDRLGHEDGSVQGRYSHITHAMRAELLAGLTSHWTAALDARRAMSPGSPVAVLDRLLRTKS